MKDQLKRFIVSKPILEKTLFLLLKLRFGTKAEKLSLARKNLSIFDIEGLCNDMPYYPGEHVIDNNIYGQAYHLKKYSGINTDLKGYMEHGLFFGGMVHADTYYWHFQRVITFSEHRKRYIEKKIPNKKAIPVGPYVHYAERLYEDSEFDSLKQELGRTLLVFPAHSVINVSAKFNALKFLDEIDRRKKDFDTVLISLYYIDAKNPLVRKIYEERGYKIVTSGHRYDLNFIARHRTIIELSDMTMSNEVGTHLGNCIHLGKAHYVFKQELNRESDKKGELERHNKLFSKDELELFHHQKSQVAKGFSKFTPKVISQEQIELVDKYWGLSSVKSPEELRSIFS